MLFIAIHRAYNAAIDFIKGMLGGALRVLGKVMHGRRVLTIDDPRLSNMINVLLLRDLCTIPSLGFMGRIDRGLTRAIITVVFIFFP